jgi:PAS domain S-box-containing protein
MTDRFAALAGIASDWWWQMDAELRFTYLSPRFTDVFGIPHSSVLGKSRTEVPRGDYDNPAWAAHLEDLAQRRPFRDFETTFIDATDAVRPVKISGVPLFEPDGTFTGYIGVGHDLTELRERELEARREARKLDSILQNIDQAVLMVGPDLTVSAYNRRLVEWLQVDISLLAPGRPYEALIRHLAERGDYAPTDAEAAVAARLARARGGRRARSERTLPDGRILEVVFNPLPEGGGVTVYSDVTESRRRERALAQRDEEARQRFHSLPLPQWVYSRRNLRFLEVNDTALEKYGWSREEFLSMTIADIRPPEDAARVRELNREGLPPPPATEWRHRTKGGRVFEVEVHLRDIDFDGEPARMALVIDISARKEAERLNQRLFETSQDLIFITDGYGIFTMVSPSASRILGWEPEDMIGRGGQDFIHPEDLEPTRQELRRARHGREVRNFRSRYRHRDGRFVSLLWMGTWSEPDRRYYFVGRDMTELDRADAQFRQAQKMEAVGQLTGGIAHDFNNILMVVLANIEAMEDDERLPADLRALAGNVERATQRASDLTRQLLAFSRRQALQPERTDANELVAATAGLMRRTLGEAIDIETSLETGLWPVEIDRGQLQSALVNVCINARDAMPEGGRLFIETRNVTLDDRYVRQHPDAVPGAHVMIAVTDTGTGIAPEHVDRIFEPFFTTKPPGVGTGLGLSMVYGFVRQSNGHIAAYSEPGHGTTIRIYLPRNTGRAPAQPASAPAELPRGNERVLVVEDDALVRASIVGQLRGLGYDVADVSDGASALESLETRPVDLVLTDVVMPGRLNGRALTDEVARRWPEVRFVYMSGYAESAIVHHGRLDPGVLLLSKPFRRRDLALVLRRALDEPRRRA